MTNDLNELYTDTIFIEERAKLLNLNVIEVDFAKHSKIGPIVLANSIGDQLINALAKFKKDRAKDPYLVLTNKLVTEWSNKREKSIETAMDRFLMAAMYLKSGDEKVYKQRIKIDGVDFGKVFLVKSNDVTAAIIFDKKTQLHQHEVIKNECKRKSIDMYPIALDIVSPFYLENLDHIIPFLRFYFPELEWSLRENLLKRSLTFEHLVKLGELSLPALTTEQVEMALMCCIAKGNIWFNFQEKLSNDSLMFYDNQTSILSFLKMRYKILHI